MKKIRLLLIILIIINIVLLIYLIATNSVKTYTLSEYADTMSTKNDIATPVYKDENQTDLSNILNGIAEKYIGEIPINKATDKLTDLINGGFKKIYNDTKGMNSQNLKVYLEANKGDIAMKTGITGIVDFYAFIEKIQIYKDDITFEKAEIVENSYKNGNQYDNFIVRISYNNGKSLDFVILLSNKDFIDTPIIIIK